MVTQTPEVTWAQRSSTSDQDKNYVFITIGVPDCDPKQMKLDIQPTEVKYSGHSLSKKIDYAVDMPLYAEIDPSMSKTHHTAANIQLKLIKKEKKEEYWPRLLKDSKKAHYLRTDFDKWVDEDEQNEAPEDDYMNQFGGGGMGDDGGFGGIDFSKLGQGGGGMPGMEGLGGEDADEDEEDDDEEMPDLADSKEEDADAGKGKAKAKIEEL